MLAIEMHEVIGKVRKLRKRCRTAVDVNSSFAAEGHRAPDENLLILVEPDGGQCGSRIVYFE